MHVGRVHNNTILTAFQNGAVIKRGPGRPRKEHTHEHAPNGDTTVMTNGVRRASKLGGDKRDAIVAFIQEHHKEYTTKAACFHAAMEATGSVGLIKENSVAVARHFEMAMEAAKKDGKKTSKVRRVRGDTVDKVLAHYATQPVDGLECMTPGCHYNLNLLVSNDIPAQHCPGCGTSLRTFIDQLLNLVTKR